MKPIETLFGIVDEMTLTSAGGKVPAQALTKAARVEYHRLKALADLVPKLVEALARALGWMHRWNQDIDDVPYEVSRDMSQMHDTLAAAQKLIAKDKEEP